MKRYSLSLASRLVDKTTVSSSYASSIVALSCGTSVWLMSEDGGMNYVPFYQGALVLLVILEVKT